RPDRSRGASRDAESDWRKGSSEPPHRPRGRRVSREGGSESFVEKAGSPPPTEQAEVAGKQQKKTKVLTRKHKSHVGEGGSRSRSKGKEPAASPERPEAPDESEEGAASPVHERPRSMKDLFKTKVHKGDQGYYALLMSNLGHQDPEKELKARWAGLKNSTKVWNNSSTTEEYGRGLLHSQLARELYTLPSEVLMARATKEMVLGQHFQMALVDRVHDAGRLITFMDHRVRQLQEELDALKLREELEKIKGERAEELLRREASEKELQAIRGHLGDAQQLLKEARARARRMDDELLQAVKDLEHARAELPRQAVAQYKGSLGFKEGLKRMGRVTYEYGYRVALARFRARYPDADIEEDPFTIYPEDDSVPMERQQDFDDSASVPSAISSVDGRGTELLGVHCFRCRKSGTHLPLVAAGRFAEIAKKARNNGVRKMIGAENREHCLAPCEVGTLLPLSCPQEGDNCGLSSVCRMPTWSITPNATLPTRKHGEMSTARPTATAM
ncbi:hypothetical protein GW17_00015063, partial [Ensete ventricosum]